LAEILFLEIDGLSVLDKLLMIIVKKWILNTSPPMVVIGRLAALSLCISTPRSHKLGKILILMLYSLLKKNRHVLKAFSKLGTLDFLFFIRLIFVPTPTIVSSKQYSSMTTTTLNNRCLDFKMSYKNLSGYENNDDVGSHQLHLCSFTEDQRKGEGTSI